MMWDKETVEQTLKRCLNASNNGPMLSLRQQLAESFMREQIFHMCREKLREFIEGMNGWQCVCRIWSKEIEEKVQFRRGLESSDSDSDDEETVIGLKMFADEDGEGDY